MVALTDCGGESRNGETTDESNGNDIVGRSPAHTQRNKVSAVVSIYHNAQWGSEDCQVANTACVHTFAPLTLFI
jgi:hypothetical protein